MFLHMIFIQPRSRFRVSVSILAPVISASLGMNYILPAVPRRGQPRTSERAPDLSAGPLALRDAGFMIEYPRAAGRQGARSFPYQGAKPPY